MRSINRREFFTQSAAATLAAGAMNVARANEPGVVAEQRLRIAVMGSRVRGRCHVSAILAQPNVEIAYLCDADLGEVGPTVERIERKTGKRPKIVQDIRHALDDPAVQALSIAAPNHWHVLAAVWACQAGKHVYVEKPISQTVVEGQRLVEFARHSGKIVQHGTQNRSNESIRQAVAFMQAGKLGRVSLARAINYKRRPGIGKGQGPAKIPAGVDFNLWLGPAAESRLSRRELHYDWHWFWDTGSGDIGNQGVHQLDIALWGLGKTVLPQTVQSLGGRLGLDDDGQTPNTQAVGFDYGDCQLICEVRNLPSPACQAAETGVLTGNIFYGSEGILVRDHKDNICRAYLGKDPTPITFGAGHKTDMDTLDREHFSNFFASIRGLDTPRADARIGHVSSALCHLANISHRLGRETPLGERPAISSGFSELADTWERTRAHLVANGVAPDSARYCLGRVLKVDAASETFRGDDQANALLSRDYRVPFLLPQRA